MALFTYMRVVRNYSTHRPVGATLHIQRNTLSIRIQRALSPLEFEWIFIYEILIFRMTCSNNNEMCSSKVIWNMFRSHDDWKQTAVQTPNIYRSQMNPMNQSIKLFGIIPFRFHSIKMKMLTPRVRRISCAPMHLNILCSTNSLSLSFQLFLFDSIEFLCICMPKLPFHFHSRRRSNASTSPFSQYTWIDGKCCLFPSNLKSSWYIHSIQPSILLIWIHLKTNNYK